MTPHLKPATFRMDVELLEGLEEVRRRDGVGVSEQVRRAVRAWLEEKGVLAGARPRRGLRARGRSRAR